FTHRPRNDPKLYGGPYPFIQTGDVARVEKMITEYTQTLNQHGLKVSKLFPSGTLVMTIAANIGDVALLDFEACFPDSIVGFFPQENVNRDYLYRVFQAKRSEFIREAPVNTQGNLNVDRIGSRAIPVPPLHDQIAITSYLDSTIEGITTTIDLANREMNLFREYRTRLVADVVTGKLDVREAAAELPQIDPETHDDGVNSILSEQHLLNARHDNEQEARP
ncbi:MAG: restriction endonuclease subunit S, partial [Gammaproteobacteria bacterium]|nr:restriction endonuclease subunit S [Gammaproteobacteria bacterium]